MTRPFCAYAHQQRHTYSDFDPICNLPLLGVAPRERGIDHERFVMGTGFMSYDMHVLHHLPSFRNWPPRQDSAPLPRGLRDPTQTFCRYLPLGEMESQGETV